jgi:hypothetical protein
LSVERLASTVGAAALALVASLALAASSWGSVTVTPIAQGLDNPRDLAFGPDGSLYVAEAGRGGNECFKSPSHEPGEPEETQCVGFTSAVSRIDGSGAHKVLTGFFSISEEGGFGATGVDGISLQGNRLFGIEAGSAAALPTTPPPGISAATLAGARAQVGRLGVANPSGKVSVVADVGDFDFQWSTEHKELVPEQFPDANPYGVLAAPGGEYVVDAGANTLDFVKANGSISVLAFIPNPPSSDSVPTCVDQGPDGAIYLSELTGGGNVPGAANVYRWTSSRGLELWASGLTAVTGCGFGPGGRFYATEFSTNGLDHAAPGTGAVVQVPPHSTSPTTIVSGLNFPGGFAGGNGAIFVSNWSIAPGNSGGGPTGEVLRISG